MQDIVPGSEPFLYPRGDTGCLLIHGITAMPEEMRYLGMFLAANGITVYGARLAGHATHPNYLKQTRWTDWMVNVEDGLAVLSGMCSKRVLIGQSMGGVIALTAAARYEVDGVVTLSTPYGNPPRRRFLERIRIIVQPTVRKNVQRFPKDHPLYHRRELNYPAYPEFPARIFIEFERLSRAMMTAVPKVNVPALLIHSRQDPSVPFTCLQVIYAELGSPQKEKLAVDDMGHSIVRDPKRQEVFDVILKFLLHLAEV